MPQHHLLLEIARGAKSAVTKKRIITYYMYNRSSTIPDLAKELDLSVPTVTKFIMEMCEDGFIVNYGKLETGEGRPPTLYGLNADSGYFVGVDVRKTDVNIGLMNFTGDIIDERVHIPFQLVNTPEALDTLCSLISAFVEENAALRDKILQIGVNISGRVNPEQGYSFSLFNFDERPLNDILTDKIGLPVSIDNDTRAMTYGEYMKGVVRGEKDVVFVNLSWGLGVGLVINGQLYIGKSGFAGELGHFSVFDNEILCHCGKKGCLETEVSGMALHRKLCEQVAQGKSSILSKRILTEKDKVTLGDIIEATNKEDLLCIELVEKIGVLLGRYLAGVINLLNPELVIIGGSLSATEDYILLPVKGAIRKYTLNLVNKDSLVVLSKLKDKAGMVGACLLVRSKLFES
ncbi:ROK family transcriptional regulator [uncultured Phocaeicola sp.]|uniref:ROK family transcriptional regulator n=1 Tax=uncultured Phocaeicola sp. TaxID=990718 RepID=UPI0025D879DE|nr:ROK family transcriptional regulator [uncultured Phocaeicola sp.]